MAARLPNYDLVLKILQLFRERIGKQDAWTAEEIVEELGDPEYWYWRRVELMRFSLPDDPEIKDVAGLVEAILHSLAGLGLVNGNGDREESSGFQRWSIASSWQPPEPPRDGGPGDPGGTAGGGAEGGGITEALSHPVLFALDSDDFDELIDNLFGEIRE